MRCHVARGAALLARRDRPAAAGAEAGGRHYFPFGSGPPQSWQEGMPGPAGT
jgi:hypothetical protein